MSTQSRTTPDFTVLDWIGTSMTVSAIVALASLAFVVPTFWDLFYDFEDFELPALTRLTTRVGFRPSRRRIDRGTADGSATRAVVGRRRFWVVMALVSALASVGLCLVGAYQPILRARRRDSTPAELTEPTRHRTATGPPEARN